MVYNFTERFDPDELFGDRLRNLESRLNSISRSGDAYSQIFALEELRNQVEVYSDNLYRAYNELMREDEILLKEIPEQQALQDIREQAYMLLDREVENAVLINQEFNHPMFLDRLSSAVYNERTINLSVVNHVLRVTIDLNSTAGKLSDWISAIKQARKIISRKKNTPEPMRSHMWMEKFYKPAREGGTVIRYTKKGSKDITQQQIDKYFYTMNLRFELCNSVAPFWHILNDGIASYNDKSGGTAYPTNTRTDFVRHAREAINRKYRELRNSYSKKISQEYDRIKKLYLLREQQVDRLLVVINEKIRQLQASQQVQPGIKYQEEMNFLKQHLGDEKFLRADRAKLLYLSRALQEEQYIPPRIGLGGGVRKRTIMLVRKYRRGY